MTVIDRFENDIAVLETDSGIIEVNREYLPEYAKEGDVLVFSGDGWTVDSEATEQRKERIRELMKRLIKHE